LDWNLLRQVIDCPAQAMVCGTSSGSLAMFAAIRRASSRVMSPVTDRSAHLDLLAPLPAELIKTPGN
jgi:hypothetical protein